jgi:hypothetical protein
MQLEKGYVVMEYKGSYAYNTVMHLHTKEQLEYRLGCSKGAVRFHTENNNPSQVKFFSDEVKLIEKKLKRIKSKDGRC